MTDRSLNTTTCLTICGLGVFASPLLGTDLYSVTGSESRSVTPYGDSFKENGSTVSRPAQTWGEGALRWGGAKIRAGARVSSIYDDNIIFNSPNRQKDLIWTVTPMFGLGLGAYAAWLTGTALGAFAGGGALEAWPAVSAGLGFMLPALFLALLLSMLTRAEVPLIAVAGAVTVVVMQLWPGPAGLIAGMVAGAVAGVTGLGRVRRAV